MTPSPGNPPEHPRPEAHFRLKSARKEGRNGEEKGEGEKDGRNYEEEDGKVEEVEDKEEDEREADEEDEREDDEENEKERRKKKRCIRRASGEMVVEVKVGIGLKRQEKSLGQESCMPCAANSRPGMISCDV